MPAASQQKLQALCTEILQKHGVSAAHSAIIADHLLYNEMCGKASHGLVRVKWITDGLAKCGLPEGEPFTETDLTALAVVNGNNTIGLVAAMHAAEIAISKASTHGVAFVGVKNYHTTTGTMHVYNKKIMEAGLVGIIGCNSVAMVCHPEGIEPVQGTNPLSIAIPSKHTGFLHDITTSEMSYGAIMVLKKQGKDVPLGVMIDAQGAPSQNPRDAFDGAMLPLKGFKGFGLGLAVELLAGPVIGAKGGRSAVEGSDGLFIIAINPAKLGNAEKIAGDIESVLQEIKSGRKPADVQELQIPGERARKTYEKTAEAGKIEITQSLWDELERLRQG